MATRHEEQAAEYHARQAAGLEKPDAPPGTPYFAGNSSAYNPYQDRPGDNLDYKHVVKPSVGYYGGDPRVAGEEERRYAGLAGAADARQGPQMNLAAYEAARAAEARGAMDQQTALSGYRGMIEGRGPSLAALQQQQGLASANQQAAGQMANVRGGGASMIAQQNAGIGYGGMGASGAVGQAAAARAGEQAHNLQGYMGLAGAARGQGLERAGMSSQTAYQQAALEQQQRALNDQRNMGYEDLRQGVFQTQNTAASNMERFEAGLTDIDRDYAQRQADIALERQRALIAGVGSGASSGLALAGNYLDDDQAPWKHRGGA